MRTSSILISILCLFALSCQKENLANKKIPANPKEDSMVKNVKKYYDIVKAANNHQIIERDGISLSLDDALAQIETLFSYTYGDYDVKSSNSYSFTDTIIISCNTNTIDENDFASLFNQVYNISKLQFLKINSENEKYFYHLDLSKLDQTNTTVTLSVNSLFGAIFNGSNDLTPVGEWPKSVFPDDCWAYLDGYNCNRLIGINHADSLQAPRALADMIDTYKDYLNFNPIYNTSNENPDLPFTLVYGNYLTLDGSSHYTYHNNKQVYNTENPNHWDTLLHQTNPSDNIPGDCIKDFNCWKFSNLNSYLNNNTPIDCAISAPSKKLYKEDMDYYFDRFMNMILESKNHYNRDVFYKMIEYGGSEICVDGFCSHWWAFSIQLANVYSIPTKPQDKLTFPEALN